MLYLLSCGRNHLVHAASSFLLQGWPALLSSNISRSWLAIPIWEAHPICSFLCCETGVSVVYQLSNAPACHVHIYLHLPLVHNLTALHASSLLFSTTQYYSTSISSNATIVKLSRIRASSRPAQILRRTENYTGTIPLYPYNAPSLLLPARIAALRNTYSQMKFVSQRATLLETGR